MVSTTCDRSDKSSRVTASGNRANRVNLQTCDQTSRFSDQAIPSAWRSFEFLAYYATCGDRHEDDIQSEKKYRGLH